MQQYEPEQIAKVIIIIGLVIISAGIMIFLLGKVGLFKLPGDIRFQSKNFKLYFPLASSVIISIVLTLILWLISYLKK